MYLLPGLQLIDLTIFLKKYPGNAGSTYQLNLKISSLKYFWFIAFLYSKHLRAITSQ